MEITRRLLVLSCALGAIGLGGCGGSGGGGWGVASIPAPPPAPPSPAPTPTPTPAAATYSSFEGATELSSFAFGLSGDFAATQAADGNYVITDFDYRPFEVGPGTNSYAFTQPSPGVFDMDTYGFGGSRFELADGGELFDQRGYDNEILQVSKPGVGLDLTYTRFGNYSWGTSGSGYISFLALGVPTLDSDVPRTGTASYNGFVDGLWDDGDTTRRLFGSTATMSVDFGAGTLLTTLTLTGRDNPFGDFLNSPSTFLGTFFGSGTIASRNYFSGGFNQQAGWSGGFAGAFNGPQASEYGYVFGLTNSSGAVASGSAVGQRN